MKSLLRQAVLVIEHSPQLQLQVPISIKTKIYGSTAISYYRNGEIKWPLHYIPAALIL